MVRLQSSIALTLGLMIASTGASAQWWNPVAPADYEECAEQAAKDGKTQSGLGILLQSCRTKFPASRKPDGKGYVFFDTRTNSRINVDSPSLSSADRRRIEEAYADYQRQQMAREAAQREDEQRRKEEATRAWRDYSARADAVKAHIQWHSRRMECVSSAHCSEKTITLTVKNDSPERLTGVRVGWAVFPRPSGNIACPVDYSQTQKIAIDIASGSSASLSFKTSDGPKEGPLAYCVDIVGVELPGAPDTDWWANSPRLR